MAAPHDGSDEKKRVIAQKIEEMRRRVTERAANELGIKRVTVSAGLAHSDVVGLNRKKFEDDYDKIFKAADKAAFKAKGWSGGVVLGRKSWMLGVGRNRLAVYDPTHKKQFRVYKPEKSRYKIWRRV